MHGSDPSAPGWSPSISRPTHPTSPVEMLWANLKRQELANLATNDLGEVMAATHRGIERIRCAWWLPYAFARRCGIHFW